MIEEVRMARRIMHPAICRIYDVGDDGDVPFLTMELIDGDNLETLLERCGRFSSAETARIGASIAAGLATAHDAGVIHRDLKPANVLVDSLGAVRLTDFGISSFSGAWSGTTERYGTPTYMAPEELTLGHPPSVRGDLYSLGVLLYEMATGDPPFDATERQLLEDQYRLSWIEAPSRRAPDIDRRLEACISRLLSWSPTDRPTSASAVALDLARVARGPARRVALESFDLLDPDAAAGHSMAHIA
jgi:serine/threonine-protein kinase